MTGWTPISEKELDNLIINDEKTLTGKLWNFWQLIKITPVKWMENEYGQEGGGFWVVAICGTKVIWYNDIEDGFNISDYKNYGEIDGYFCNQDELSWVVVRLFNLIKFGGDIVSRLPPESLNF